jgi:hypothetical protein
VKLLPSQVGAEPKKVAVLGAIVVVAAVVYWTNHTAAPEALANVTTKTVTEPAALKSVPELTPKSAAPVRDNSPMPAKRSVKGAQATGSEDGGFRPTLKPKEGVDVTRIDPTLQLDLLAKLREVPMEGGSRNLFEFGQAAAPPPPKVAPIVVPPPTVTKAAPPTPPAKPPEPPTPAAPPIPLKYYGFAGTIKESPRRGLFLEGDPATGNIFIAAENEILKGRYKVIRFGVDSVVMEDTTTHNQQPLPLQKEADQ